MGAFETYIYSGRYKLWKDVQLAVKDGYGPVYRSSEIRPIAGSKIKLIDTIALKVVDDTHLGVGGFTWYFSLYDFEKYGATRTKYSYRGDKSKSFKANKFYDDSLEEKLGGFVQTLG